MLASAYTPAITTAEHQALRSAVHHAHAERGGAAAQQQQHAGRHAEEWRLDGKQHRQHQARFSAMRPSQSAATTSAGNAMGTSSAGAVVRPTAAAAAAVTAMSDASSSTCR
jgi:hypothetical protein